MTVSLRQVAPENLRIYFDLPPETVMGGKSLAQEVSSVPDIPEPIMRYVRGVAGIPVETSQGIVVASRESFLEAFHSSMRI